MVVKYCCKWKHKCLGKKYSDSFMCYGYMAEASLIHCFDSGFFCVCINVVAVFLMFLTCIQLVIITTNQ